ncbi:hypothetical protein B0A55_10916, partial [Friedmanniomyces simplex]
MISFYALSLLPAVWAITSCIGLNDQQTFHSLHDTAEYDPFSGHGFDEYIKATLNEFLTPGLTIAIIHGNRTFSKAYGYSDLAKKEPMTPRTLFYAGSTTKSFTAATMSKLVDSNDTAYSHIDWSTKMVELIRDDFLLQDEWTTNHVTLTDALSHRSGMPRNDMSWTNGDPSVKEQVRQLRFLPLHNEIRTKFEYCNLMFAAVSHAIETVTGIAIGILLKQRFWEPLGMHATFYSIEDALAYAEEIEDTTVATGYLYDNAAKSHLISPHSAIPPANGAGGVISNVLDYTHW